MNKVTFKMLLKKITKSFSQFISIAAITAVGVAMYVGVLSVPSTMQTNANDYLNNQKTSDVELIKSSGFTKKDINKIKDIGKNTVSKSIIADASVIYDGNEILSRLHTTTSQNKNRIVEGRDIKNDDECLVSESVKYNLLNKKISMDVIGDKKKCKVVGIIQSPQYLSDHNKGYSTKSIGEIELLVYTKAAFAKEFFGMIPNYNPYNSLSITFNDKDNTNFFSKEYKDEMATKVKLIEKTLDDDSVTIKEANKNQSIKDYNEDSSRIAEIAAIFPVIFFLVATLVASSTMSRMVEDERMQIGTMSSLGYSKPAIILQYLIYSLLAITIGSVIGVLVGVNVIPQTVMIAYETLYPLPSYFIVYDTNIIVQAIAIATLLISGSTVLVVYSQIKNSCADLLRPKAPPAGKKTLLENISFIWNRLSFMNKVNARNLFRYKKRLLMTTLAIMGCSGLLMTGLGIESSIAPIVKRQFGEIYKYDLQTGTKDLNNKDANEFSKEILKNKNIEDLSATNRKTGTVTYKDSDYDLNVITPQNISDFNSLIKLDSKFTSNDIVITKKIAQSLELKKNDKIKIKIDNEFYEFRITGITTQYIGNYLYLNKEAYTKEIGNIKYNNFLIKTNGNVDNAIKYLEDNNKVTTLIDTTAFKDNINDSLSGVNNLVYILIAFAGILVMIVMYTLTNINLIERRRELATLKVLGFFEREVETYIFKENVILTVLGLIIGLVFGKYLHIYIMSRVEMSDLYFLREQPIQNYVYTFILTLVFSLSVNLLMKRKIKKIDMVESLKSVE